ncbi:hypothetical protein [Brevundimonas sp. DC300-4]|uniref:hypothetical protein n=1 Tax=Brevundimonas sp. DC300-4 TaxID=2804594 RepID=UPI003CF76D68
MFDVSFPQPLNQKSSILTERNNASEELIFIEFALLKWNNDSLVRYERLTNASMSEALAFAEGMITERINPARNDQALPGTTYAFEVGHRDTEVTPHYSGDVTVGVWHIMGERHCPEIVWQAKIHGGQSVN